MRTVLIYITLAFCLLPLWLGSAVAGENSEKDQDKLINALMERVKHLEEIIGEDESPFRTKPAIRERLDRIEREFSESKIKSTPSEYDLRHDLRQLNQEVQNISRRIEYLAVRVDRAEQEADEMLKPVDLSNLRRDIEQLQRKLDNLK